MRLSRRSLILGASAAFIARPAAAFVVPRNPLVFPGGSPGFNPSHPAAKGIAHIHGFSGVATGSGFTNLVTGGVGVESTVMSFSSSNLGPSLLLASGGTDSISFSGTTIADHTATMAVIGMMTASSTGQGLMCTDFSGSGGFRFDIGDFTLPGVIAITTIAPSINIPFFYASSKGPTAVNTVIKYLTNGELLTGVVADSSTANTPGGATQLVGAQAGVSAITGNLNAAMWTPAFMNLPQLIAWSQAPWDFWYPPTEKQMMFAGIGHNTGGAVSPYHGLPMMGVGN